MDISKISNADRSEVLVQALPYIQKYQNIYKSSGKTVIINSIDHKFKQYPPYQNGKRCDQHRLQEDTEF